MRWISSPALDHGWGPEPGGWSSRAIAASHVVANSDREQKREADDEKREMQAR